MKVDLDVDEQWEKLIKAVNKDQIPINCVKKVLFKLKGGKQKTINLKTLKGQGLELEEIELILTRSMVDLQTNIINIDYVIDVDSVKQVVQPLTDKILSRL